MLELAVRWWVRREEGGLLKVANRVFLTKQRQAARSVKGCVCNELSDLATLRGYMDRMKTFVRSGWNL